MDNHKRGGTFPKSPAFDLTFYWRVSINLSRNERFVTTSGQKAAQEVLKTSCRGGKGPYSSLGSPPPRIIQQSGELFNDNNNAPFSPIFVMQKDSRSNSSIRSMASNSSDVDSSEFEDNTDEFSPDSEENEGDDQQVNCLSLSNLTQFSGFLTCRSFVAGQDKDGRRSEKRADLIFWPF